jgi:ribonuclease HIII
MKAQITKLENQIETLTVKMNKQLKKSGYDYADVKYNKMFANRKNCKEALTLLNRAVEVLSWNN